MLTTRVLYLSDNYGVIANNRDGLSIAIMVSTRERDSYLSDNYVSAVETINNNRDVTLVTIIIANN